MGTNKPRHVALVLVAKWPTPGRVKTRLMSQLSAQTAAAVHAAFLQHIRTVCESLAAGSEGIELVLLFDPPETPELWNQWTLWRRIPQSQGGLGERMEAALEMLTGPLLAGCVFIGADAPELMAEHITWACNEVQQSHHAMIPAYDGGYVLVGVPAGSASLFAGIAWSTPQVAEQTRAVANHRKVVLSELPTMHDIDTPKDLALLLERFRADDASTTALRRQLAAIAGTAIS